MIDDVDTDAHFVLCSHSHGGWKPIQRADGVWFIHPGAMTRLTLPEAHRTPGVYLLDLIADPVAVSWRSLGAVGSEIFDHATAEEEAGWEQRIGTFLTRMAEGVDSGMDLTWRIDQLAEETGLEPEVLDEIRNRLLQREAASCG